MVATRGRCLVTALLPGTLALLLAAGSAPGQSPGACQRGGQGTSQSQLRSYQRPSGPLVPPYQRPSGPAALSPASWYANPYYPNGYDPTAAYLQAAADLTQAQGQMLLNEQQGYQLREQVRAARLDNRRKAFDLARYQRDNTPTAEEERQRFLRQQLERSRNDPPLTEVWSGQSLNVLLADLSKQLGRADVASLRTFASPLDEEGLKRINVRAGAGGSLGIFRNGGRFSWPLALSDTGFQEGRDQIGSLAQDAVQQAISRNRVDVGTAEGLRAAVERMQRQLKQHGGDLSFDQYRDARAFLNRLGDAAQALRQPDVAHHFTGKYALAAAHTVRELVQLMADQGLQFAPALPGDEGAYLALQHVLAGYSRSTADGQALASR